MLTPSVRNRGVKFIWGEVKQLNGAEKTATIKTMFSSTTEEVPQKGELKCS